MELLDFTLRVPAHRKHCADWVVAQSPEVVADVFFVTEATYKLCGSLATLQSGADLADQVQRHDREMDAARKREEALQSQMEWMKASREQCLREVEEQMREAHAASLRTAAGEAQRVREAAQRLHDEQVRSLVESHDHKTRLEVEALRAAHAREQQELQAEVDALREKHMHVPAVHETLQRTNELLQQYASNVKSGQAGEDIFRRLMSNQDYFFVEDTTRSTEAGCEDFLVTHPDGLSCSVEVKLCQKMHNTKDMQKHRERIKEAARMGKINFGLFLSLRSGIPNMPSICLETHCNVPVLYVSAREGESPPQVAEVGIRVLRAVWQRLKKEKAEAGPQAADAIVAHVSALLQQQQVILAKFDTELSKMTRQLNQSLQTVKSMSQIRQSILDSIDNLIIEHPCLQQDDPTSDSDSDSSGQDAAIRSILAFHATNRKFPSSASCLPEGCCAGGEREFKKLLGMARKRAAAGGSAACPPACPPAKRAKTQQQRLQFGSAAA